MQNISEYALKFINEYVLKKMKDKKEFRSRARDIYSNAYFEGLIPTLVFAYSKATEDKVKSLFNGENKFDESEEGYGFYVFSIIKFLKEECLKIDVDASVDSLINSLKDKSIENKVLIYMRWLKYFAEAKIEAG